MSLFKEEYTVGNTNLPKALYDNYNYNLSLQQHKRHIIIYKRHKIAFSRFNDLLYRLNDKSFNRDICCFDFRSNFLVSISFLINIGKEMSHPGFRTYTICIITIMTMPLFL